MKIYNIYPTDKDGMLLGSAVFQSFSRKEAFMKLKNLDLYSEDLAYTLNQIDIFQPTATIKILKIKVYEKK